MKFQASEMFTRPWLCANAYVTVKNEKKSAVVVA